MHKTFLLALGLAATCFCFAAQTDRPNIVWIVSEDNSADWLRLYNPEHGAPMPNVEKLAAQGLLFNHAFY